MIEIVAQAGSINAEWIIGGLASAFCAFAVWVGKFLKQIWNDVKVIWVEFKVMHVEEIKTLEAVIEKQDTSNQKAHERTTKILSKTLELERHMAETKDYTLETKDVVTKFRVEIDSIHSKIIALERFNAKIKTIDVDNHSDFIQRLRDSERNQN